METAARANKVAQAILEMIPEGDHPRAACMLAQLVNLGFRCNPRAAHGTIRYNAVRAAVQDMPVRVRMVEVTTERGGKPVTFKALTTDPVGVPDAKPIVEDAVGDDE